MQWTMVLKTVMNSSCPIQYTWLHLNKPQTIHEPTNSLEESTHMNEAI